MVFSFCCSTGFYVAKIKKLANGEKKEDEIDEKADRPLAFADVDEADSFGRKPIEFFVAVMD